MMAMQKQPGIIEQAEAFKLDGEPIFCQRYGSGHINETYLLVDDTAREYVLQKINQKVFRDPVSLMGNIVAVTSHLAKTAESVRSVLELVPTRDGAMWLVDGGGEYWRLYSFIADSVCYQQAESVAVFRESAAAFGAFQRGLADFPAQTLAETIPAFHDTPRRYAALRAAIESDAAGRAGGVRAEIDFALAREKYASTLMDRHASGALPSRVTHNDTKLNNVLFDRRTRKQLCVIDLDTVMPGLSVNDFGDSIRFGASTAAEDERDLSKVNFSLPLFDAYAEGFLTVCGGSMAAGEVASLCDGAMMMTLECGVRFLTDHLSGDTYFRVHRDGHNLDRCRTQFKLVAEMEKSWDKMQAAIRTYA